MLRRDRQPSWSVRAAGMPSVLKQQQKNTSKARARFAKGLGITTQFQIKFENSVFDSNSV